jgi:hypothetical protein
MQIRSLRYVVLIDFYMTTIKLMIQNMDYVISN